MDEEVNRIVEIRKARSGTTGVSVGMLFDPKTLRYVEKGVVKK